MAMQTIVCAPGGFRRDPCVDHQAVIGRLRDRRGVLPGARDDGLPAVKAARRCAGPSGRGVVSEVALARRDSPARGSRHLGFAKALVQKIRHNDHAQPRARGGPTTAENGLGACERRNYTKEATGWRVSTNIDETDRHTAQFTSQPVHTTAPRHLYAHPPSPSATSKSVSASPWRGTPPSRARLALRYAAHYFWRCEPIPVCAVVAPRARRVGP